MGDDFILLDNAQNEGLAISLSRFLEQTSNFDKALAKTYLWAAEDVYVFSESNDREKDRRSEDIESIACIEWIGNAGQHILSATIPETLPAEIRVKAETLRAKCYKWMYPKSNRLFLRKEDLDQMIAEADELLRLVSGNQPESL